MRKLWIPLLAALTGLSLAGTAQAATLQYDGTLELGIGTLPPIEISGSGLSTVNGSGGSGHLSTLHLGPGITATQTVIVPITDPEVINQGIVSLRATAVTLNASFPLSFLHLGGSTTTVTDAANTGGVLPVSGKVLVCLITKGCGSNLQVPITTNVTRGMGIGGGVITVNGFAQAGLRLSVQGNPWTIGTAVITGIPQDNGGVTTSTRKGFVHGPVSGTDASSAALPSGVIQLVTPVIVNTTLTGTETLALFGTLRLHFVPEPGTLLLLGSGVAGLALLGRRRM